MSKETPPSTTMQIRLKTPLHQWVRAEAERQERSANWVISKLVEAAAVKGSPGGAAPVEPQQ